MRCDKAKIVLACLAAVFTACGLMAEEKVAIWNGKSDRSWFTPGNWVDGVVPGLYTTTVNGTTVTNGSPGWTARFERSGTDWIVNLEGNGGTLLSISNIVFSGANGTYSIRPNYKTIRLEEGGGIYVEESHNQNLDFQCPIGIYNQKNSSSVFVLENNSSKRFNIVKGFSNFVMDGVFGYPHMRIKGSGKTWLMGTFPGNSGFRPYLDVALSEGGELHVTNTVDNFLGVYVPSGLPAQHIVVKSGSLLKPGVLSNSEQVRVYSDTEISGAGKLSLNLTTEASSDLYVGQGAVMTIATAVTNRNNTADASFRVSGASGDRKGIVRFTGRNTIPQDIDIRTAIVEARTIGMAGAEGDIGLGRSIKIENNGVLRYTGSGETTDRAIVLGYYTNGLEQAGTGPVTFTGNVVSSNYLGTIVFCNDTEFPATLAGRILAGTYNPIVIKRGTGEWILSGANTTQGMYYLEDGTLTVGSTSSLPRLTVAGDGVLRVADGVTATVSLTYASGSLDVVLGTGSKFVARDRQGMAPDWLTVDGKPARFRSNGELVPRLGCVISFQ